MRYTWSLPEQPDSMVGSLVRWLVREGDRVRRDQPLAHVHTPIADIDLPSPVAGRIVALHARPGEDLASGPFITFEVEPDDGKQKGPACAGP